MKRVPPEINRPEAGGVLCVGRDPGDRETETGRPFVGPAGEQLERVLALAGLSRTDINIANVVPIQPSGSDFNQHHIDDVESGIDALNRLIIELKPRLIISWGTRPPMCVSSIGPRSPAPVLGITGTGGAGKSSLTDELVRRFRLDQDDALRIAILSVDPTRRRSGGALLGDRIRMNSLAAQQVFMRSLATRESRAEIAACLPDAVGSARAAGFDLVIAETSGIGQGDAAIAQHADVSLYVMTPEFGAASQLVKIDMLAFADFVAINKFDRRVAEDALRDVRKQVQRNREAFKKRPEDMPVFGTIAARFTTTASPRSTTRSRRSSPRRDSSSLPASCRAPRAACPRTSR